MNWGYFDGTIKIVVRGTTGQRVRVLSSGYSVLKYEGIMYSRTVEFWIVF